MGIPLDDEAHRSSSCQPQLDRALQQGVLVLPAGVIVPDLFLDGLADLDVGHSGLGYLHATTQVRRHPGTKITGCGYERGLVYRRTAVEPKERRRGARRPGREA